MDPDIGKRGAIADQLVYRSTDFEILETLGTGTFSRVKLVRNVMEDRMRVAKIIRKSDIIGHDLFRYVSMEVKLLRTLDHPFIIKSLGKYQDEESLVIIFELLRGGDLHRRLSNSPRPRPHAPRARPGGRRGHGRKTREVLLYADRDGSPTHARPTNYL